MVKKRVDPRVRGLIVDGVRKNHRSIFVLVGDHGKDQVENLHKILAKSRVRARPSVLWCYKKELGFSTHKKKRIKEIKRDKSRGLYDAERDDPFELFIASTDIRWTYYKETDKVLGQTFGMCVLQDFEALTPNILARTIETVEGGGLVIILMKTVQSLKQLFTMSMDVHARFRTDAHHEVVPRFNERFILSLGDCKNCLVLDDELNILPLSTHAAEIPTFEGVGGLEDGDADASGYLEDSELVELKVSLEETPIAGELIRLAKTADQAKAILSFLDSISEKTFKATVALTAARGRGKSAAIGLCLAGAIAYGYSNIFVTAPSPENLKTVFEFVVQGLKALKYTEHMDFEVLQEHHGEEGKVVTKVNVTRDHRQSIAYILPEQHHVLAQAELVAIDEAAAIPLPIVKKLLGPYLVFISSTVNGYEGTGRSLSLKLLQQLRTQQSQAIQQAASTAAGQIVGARSNKGARQVHEERWKVASEAAAEVQRQIHAPRVSSFGGHNNSGNDSAAISSGKRLLTELSLELPIRYGAGDPVEKWLNQLLCLEITTYATRLWQGMPSPQDCQLYLVNRDALFSYHALSEAFLQRVWSLYTSAHYKNSPNDLQMLSDAPAHRLLVLLGPQKSSSDGSNLPDILCVVQIAFEGYINQKTVQAELAKNNKASGDMIPWTLSQQYNDTEFASLSGVRIVRIATHPDVQSMGYGSRAIDLLCQYFQGDLSASVLPSVGMFGGEGAEAPSEKTSTSLSTESEGDIHNDKGSVRSHLPPLLTPLEDRPAERLHWLGVSFGLTSQLTHFWTRKGFQVCYIRQTANESTGEHSSIVLKELDCSTLEEAPPAGWLGGYLKDFRRRLLSLLSFSFRHFDTTLSLMLTDPQRVLTSASVNGGEENDSIAIESSTSSSLLEDGTGITSGKAGSHSRGNESLGKPLSATEMLSSFLTYHDLRRLEMYSRNLVDHHMIVDLLPTLSQFLFGNRLPGLRLSHLQAAILLGMGLQHRSVEDLAEELSLPANQILAFFNKTLRKISLYLKSLVEKQEESRLQANPLEVRKREQQAAAMKSIGLSMKDEGKQDQQTLQKLQKDMVAKAENFGSKVGNNNSNVSKEAQLAQEVEKSQSSWSNGKKIPSSISIARPALPVASEEEQKGDGKRGIDEHDKKKNKKSKHQHHHKSTQQHANA